MLPRIRPAAYHRWQLSSGEDWITFHRVGDSYVLRFAGLAQFRISAHGHRVHCEALQDVPEPLLPQLWNQVLPLVTNAQRATVLHAGAVEVDQGAIAFMGPTGRGKSTLTAALASEGYRFLADDALQVGVSAAGEAFAAPGQPHLRLWRDDPTAKSLIHAGPRHPHCDQQRPLSAIYLLGESAGAQPSFERVRPSASLLELLQNSFLLDPESADTLQLQHEDLSAIVRTVPVFRMRYVRSHDTLAQVCQVTVAHARSLPTHEAHGPHHRSAERHGDAAPRRNGPAAA